MRTTDVKDRQPNAPRKITRRQLLVGGGAAAAVGSIRPGSLLRPARARKPGLGQAKPAPSPIPGGVDAPPVGFIHWFLPGPTDATTPFIGLPGMGLDVEPSTMTDYQGFTAFAVVAGQARGSDGNTYNVEFDVRVMQGEYVAEDGSSQRGTFAFL